MTELLERWSRAEPERCQWDHVMQGHRLQVGASWAYATGRAADEYSFERPYVLTATMEAIEARAAAARNHNAEVGDDGEEERLWSWCLFGRVHGQHAARVWVGFPGTVGRDFDNDDDDSPAAALLSAYLTALEAE